MCHLTKKCPELISNSERAGIFPKVLSMHKFVDTNLLTQICSTKWGQWFHNFIIYLFLWNSLYHDKIKTIFIFFVKNTLIIVYISIISDENLICDIISNLCNIVWNLPWLVNILTFSLFFLPWNKKTPMGNGALKIFTGISNFLRM